MYKIISALLLTASAALAFTPTHLVIAESAALYDVDEDYDESHIVERLPYWTAVVAAPVAPTEPPRTCCHVTLENGTAGFTEWENLGRALAVVAEETTLSGVPQDVPLEVTRLKKGELVAYAPTDAAASKPGFVEVLNADGLRGWVPEDALEPTPVEGE